MKNNCDGWLHYVLSLKPNFTLKEVPSTRKGIISALSNFYVQPNRTEGLRGRMPFCWHALTMTDASIVTEDALRQCRSPYFPSPRKKILFHKWNALPRSRKFAVFKGACEGIRNVLSDFLNNPEDAVEEEWNRSKSGKTLEASFEWFGEQEEHLVLLEYQGLFLDLADLVHPRWGFESWALKDLTTLCAYLIGVTGQVEMEVAESSVLESVLFEIQNNLEPEANTAS